MTDPATQKAINWLAEARAWDTTRYESEFITAAAYLEATLMKITDHEHALIELWSDVRPCIRMRVAKTAIPDGCCKCDIAISRACDSESDWWDFIQMFKLEIDLFKPFSDFHGGP